MKTIKMLMALGMATILCMAMISFVAAADLVAVATPAAFAKAADWTALMKVKNIPVRNVAPSDSAGFKDAPYLVLMGGMDETGGIKPLVEKAVGKAEYEWINKAGNSRMFVKSNVWSGGQEVIIFAGADSAGADAARKVNRAEWWEIISGWFGIEDDAKGKGGTPAY